MCTLAVPSDGMKRSPGSEIEHGYIPIDVKWKHRLSKQISHDVIPGKAAHRSCELAGHHGGMFAVHDAGSHIAGGKDVCRTGNAHEVIHMEATKPIPLNRHRPGHGACPHARAPHDRPCRDHFTGAQRDAACVDRSDRHVEPRFHTQRRQRFADDRARWLSHSSRPRRGWDRRERRAGCRGRPAFSSLPWHLRCDFDARKAGAHDDHRGKAFRNRLPAQSGEVRVEPNGRRVKYPRQSRWTSARVLQGAPIGCRAPAPADRIP